MVSEDILRKIGGQYIAAALQASPNVETSKEDFQETIIELPVSGTTRFKCQRMTGKQGKYRYRFWMAVEAVRTEETIPFGEGREGRAIKKPTD
ncbi:hypothetical protein SAMN05216420_101334 [Nitrosospira sp. Nl5]|uniref:hypothetical protein n=1 Tax=Nitrosospira sp. Nl5 TaxID=200120 RepID=UPI00088F7ABE|nr:hypothetical protein [Nitrosospira sp. Nl5]SCX91950.1 hypothetical protein SAMN05216420_101334 [Nitrosospira sp. Nl5]